MNCHRLLGPVRLTIQCYAIISTFLDPQRRINMRRKIRIITRIRSCECEHLQLKNSGQNTSSGKKNKMEVEVLLIKADKKIREEQIIEATNVL